MKSKAKLKVLIDLLMTLALLFLSGYHLFCEIAHEWVGGGILLLFAAHHILNFSWYKGLFQGKYPPARIFQLIINLLLLVVLSMLAYSGIVLSRHVFSFLPIRGGLSLARRLHILGAYWGFLLMSFHLGTHWHAILNIFYRKIGKSVSALGAVTIFAAGLLIAGYGAYVFIKRDFFIYLFLKKEFVFLEYGESAIHFYLDYLGLMGLCVFFAHYTTRILKKIGGKKSNQIKK